MMKNNLLIMLLAVSLLTACNAPSNGDQEVPQPSNDSQQTETKKDEPTVKKDSDTEKKTSELSQKIDVENQNLLVSLSYDDQLLKKRQNGKWVDRIDVNDDSLNKRTFAWQEPGKAPKTLVELEVAEGVDLVSGPHVDMKGQKLYLQFTERNQSDDRESDGPEFEAQYLWTYDISANKEEIEKVDFRALPIEKWEANFEKLITAVDDEGGIYTRSDYPLESICAMSYDIDFFEPGTYGFGAKPSYRESSYTGCGGGVEASVTDNGNEIVTVKTDEETKQLKLVIKSKNGLKTKVLDLFKAPMNDEGVIEDPFMDHSLMVNGGVFMKEDLSKGVFYYFDTVVLFSLDTGDINVIQDDLLLMNDVNFQGSYGWIAGEFYIYDAVKNETKKINFAESSFEIESGNTVPSEAKNTLDFIKKGRADCVKTEGGIGLQRFNHCLENSAFIGLGWNSMAY